MIKHNEDKNMCSQCNGKCCKSLGCAVYPEEFKEINIKTIKEKLKKGFCFDCWDGELDGMISPYYMRAQHKHEEEKIFDPSWGGECIHLTDNRCKLSWKERPLGGRSLIPKKNINDRCKVHNGVGSKTDCCIAWKPYQDIIREIINEG